MIIAKPSGADARLLRERLAHLESTGKRPTNQPANAAAGWHTLACVASLFGFTVNTSSKKFVDECGHEGCNKLAGVGSLGSGSIGITNYKDQSITISLAQKPERVTQTLAHEVMHVLDVTEQLADAVTDAAQEELGKRMSAYSTTQTAANEIKVDTAASAIMLLFGIDTTKRSASYTLAMLDAGVSVEDMFRQVGEGMKLARAAAMLVAAVADEVGEPVNRAPGS